MKIPMFLRKMVKIIDHNNNNQVLIWFSESTTTAQSSNSLQGRVPGTDMPEASTALSTEISASLQNESKRLFFSFFYNIQFLVSTQPAISKVTPKLKRTIAPLQLRAKQGRFASLQTPRENVSDSDVTFFLNFAIWHRGMERAWKGE